MLRRLQYWLQRRDREQSLREEMELHLAEKAAELQSDGMSPAEATLEARRQFGNVGIKHEEAREIWMTRFLSELVQDIRYGLRTMLANKAFSALAVLSLALGIGANTTIYSLMESVLLRSLPVQEPESLAVLNWHSEPPQTADKQWVHVVHGIQGRFWPGDKGTLMSGIFPYPTLDAMRDPAIFTSLFGYFDGHNRNFGVRGYATSVPSEFVTGEYFHGLGVTPAAGRFITPEDDRPNATPVAVISYATSQNRFGGPANAIGQPVLIDNTPFTVVGVAPPEFFGVEPARTPDLYLPLRTILLLDGPIAAKSFHDENFYWLEMMGRLRPGVTIAQAQAAMGPRFHQWVSTTAKSEGERAKLPQLKLNPGVTGLGGLRRYYAKPLYVLLAMVGLILAIACANIANLLLARAAARRREIAVRLSLGAGRLRVIRQLLTESVLLASLGGILGALFAIWGIQALTVLFGAGEENFTLRAELNWNVLAITAGLSILCGLFFGLAPALQATRAEVLPGLQAARSSGGRHNIQSLLVVAQIAMSFVILVAAGLFVRTLNNLHSVQLGYSRENILLFTLNARQAGHRESELATFYADLNRRFASIPGVNSASLAQSSIVSAGFHGNAVHSAMKIGSTTLADVKSIAAGPNYLATMQIPLLAGRDLAERDHAAAPPVAIITERLARTYFGSENPIGRRIHLPDVKKDLEIVGVSANLRYGGIKTQEGSLVVFVPAAQFTPDRVTYALRTLGDPLRFANTVQEIVRNADSRLPVTNVLTQAAEIDRTISRELTFAKLCTGFALLALLTACVGVYGTMSYTVARQASEIGIRMALGAQRQAVVWMILRRVLILAAVALAISIPTAVAGFRVIRSLLFQTQPGDPATLALAGVVLLMAAALAAYAPARRASRIDPLVALRQD
ncbi:hypothetical protein F183_A31230 [Bryobacterales bacterium F-183]|nr:hypothetical protein F183_A31230 [Bryobacterales bacterium F-183]